ncbi:hypothetical protein EOD39_15730 [Acipenser ruthenus]|uniref:Uncharacterized protein n=1 Tax=Acipenser ruthenus TaxID=7906 RepID=A0A444UC56_ACIRT|nr:hypothetical protein EOD39_15730 [Acipenser ruthenus]
MKGATPKKQATPKKVLQLPSPEYVIYTDTELEQVRKHYFEMKHIGRKCILSKELRCRLMRNTMTNMVSILRATVEAEDVRYPSKEEITAMAKRLVEYYPMLQDKPGGSKHSWVLGELCRIVSKDNTAYIKEVKERWDTFQSQAVFYGIMKKMMKPPMTFNTEEQAINMLKTLPAMFPSAVAPPKKLGRESEALLHVLMPSEDPNTYLQRRPLSCPVLIVDKENCMVAIGTTPVATFPKNPLHEGALYLMVYYYALHMTYQKCISTLLSVLQTEVLQDEIHERDTTSSYRKAMAEWKKCIGE